MKTLTMIKIITVFVLIFFIFSNIFVSFNSPSKLIDEDLQVTIK